MNSSHADDLSGAERIEAVDEGDADLDFGGLAVWVSRGDAFSECLEAPHLGLDPASEVISGPALPERPSIVPGGTQRFVAGDCGRAVFFPRPAVLSDRDDGSGLAVDDGSVAAARIIGPVGGDRADVFSFRDLTEQLWQNRAVTIATGGKFHGADVRSGCVHCKMDLTPLAPPLNTMLADLPLAISEELNAGAVHEQVQRRIGTPVGDLNGQCLLTPAQRRIVRHGPV